MFLTGFDAPTLNTLFVDKNLKLVREIELSNSPEGLEEKMLSEEDEKSVEASAMSGSDTLPEQE